MSNDVIFVDGLIAKAPHPNAPDFVKAQLSIKREDLIAWLQQQGGDWVNVDVKEGRSGKWYASVNEWKPQRTDNGNTPSPLISAPESAGGGFKDDIPFLPRGKRNMWE